MRIPLARPEIGPAEREAAARVLSGTTLACGPEITAFEREFASYTGADGAVAMNSGTSGLIAALTALGVGPGHEVVIPGFTFVATANAVLHRGATPVLVDVDPTSMSLTAEAVAAALTPNTRAVIVVHLFGRPAPMDALVELAAEKGLALIEDACEAIGAHTPDGSVGTRGDAGVFGFYPNKPMTTGEGGMVVARDQEILSRCRALANQGRGADGWMAEALPGFSFRMTEIAAAVGRVQLASLDDRVGRLAVVADLYEAALTGQGLGLPEREVPGTTRSWFTYPVMLPEGIQRDAVQADLAAAGIASAAYFPLLQQISGLSGSLRIHGPQPASEGLASRLLSLPLWSGMSTSEVDEVASELSAGIRKLT
jgi:perosamine synthetase